VRNKHAPLAVGHGLRHVGFARYEAEGILRERFVEPDRRLARRLYNVAAWTLAFSVGAFVVALIVYWLVATGG
jgi:hypothetical protein